MNFWKYIIYAAILSVLFNICLHVNANPAYGASEEFCRQLDTEISELYGQITDIKLKIEALESENRRIGPAIEEKKEEIEKIRKSLERVVYKDSDTNKMVRFKPSEVPNPAPEYIQYDSRTGRFKAVQKSDLQGLVGPAYLKLMAHETKENSISGKVAKRRIEKIQGEIHALEEKLASNNTQIETLKEELVEKRAALESAEELLRACLEHDRKKKEEGQTVVPEDFPSSNGDFQPGDILIQPINLNLPKTNFNLLAQYMQQKDADKSNKQVVVNELDKTINSVQNNKQAYDQDRVSYNPCNTYYDPYYGYYNPNYLDNFDTDPADGITGSSLMDHVFTLSVLTTPDKHKDKKPDSTPAPCNQTTSTISTPATVQVSGPAPTTPCESTITTPCESGITAPCGSQTGMPAIFTPCPIFNSI